MFHSRKLSNRINHIHERALRLVYKDYAKNLHLQFGGSEVLLKNLTIQTFQKLHLLNRLYIKQVSCYLLMLRLSVTGLILF